MEVVYPVPGSVIEAAPRLAYLPFLEPSVAGVRWISQFTKWKQQVYLNRLTPNPLKLTQLTHHQLFH